MNPVHGLHHITAIAGNPQQNLRFYSELLGLQLIKKTVNVDDLSSYHLFYGVDGGRPGSIISFLAAHKFARGAPEMGNAVAVGFSVPTTSLDFWTDYLSDHSLDFTEPFERFGKVIIGLQDPDGLHLELIGDPAVPVHKKEEREEGPVPAEHAIRGLHGITLAEENYQATGQLLTESLGFKEAGCEHARLLYQSDTRYGNTIEVIDGAGLRGEPGKGTVHHIAFRVPDVKTLEKQRTELKSIGYHLTEIEDRYYFNSVFFYAPGGALLEIATEGRGFTVDEEPDLLGQKLSLPPQLEKRRSLIKANLPELNVNKFTE